MEKQSVDFSKIPDAPGVYMFVRQKKVLYVGKATSLRSRVKSYFVKDIAEVRSPLIEKIVQDATRVLVEETDSVLDALILEAKKIKELQPKGNTDAKDNKSWNYLVVTKEKFPRFMIIRERELSSTFSPSMVAHLFGPFPQGGVLKEALKIIRKIFPFFDTKFPLDGELSESQKKTLRFNQSIGLFPQIFDEKEYRKIVKHIVLLFEAQKSKLLKMLEREMNNYSKNEEFEMAHTIKKQLFALKHIQDIRLLKEELRVPDSVAFRIEAYDTAHSGGTASRGVMVSVVDGEAVPSEYRLFSIKKAIKGDDFGALKEIIERRAKHAEWPFPRLVVIDGGRAHITLAKKVLRDVGMDADVVSVVKDIKHKPREILGSSAYAITHESSILLANSEAHRFSLQAHRKAMRKRLK